MVVCGSGFQSSVNGQNVFFEAKWLLRHENTAFVSNPPGAGDAGDDGGGVYVCAAAGQRAEGDPGVVDPAAGDAGRSGGGVFAVDTVRAGVCAADGDADGGVAGVRAVQRGPGIDGGALERHQPVDVDHAGAGVEHAFVRLERVD